MSATVAIIMRAKDEMPYVQRSLDMLQQQTFTDFDLFAVDSGSSDGTLEALKTTCARERLSQIAPDEYVPGRILNEMIQRIDHELIVLLNADAVPLSEEWLANLIRPIHDDTADVTYSRQVARSNARFIVAYDYQRAFESEPATADFFSAAACAFRRDLWDRFKFPDEGYAEDSVWAAACRMFNVRFQLASDSVVEHSHNYTLRALFTKRSRHGSSFARLQGKTSPTARRAYLCLREIIRDLIQACRQRQFNTIPYNIAYRITLHAGMHRGIREGSR